MITTLSVGFLFLFENNYYTVHTINIKSKEKYRENLKKKFSEPDSGEISVPRVTISINLSNN